MSKPSDDLTERGISLLSNSLQIGADTLRAIIDGPDDELRRKVVAAIAEFGIDVGKAG